MCLLIFVSRSSPFVFSLLVSASPVLVCTAVLLGTFLSFGQPNTPQIDTEEREIQESVSITTGVSRIDEQNESCSVERDREKRRDEVKQPSLSASVLGEERSGEVKLVNAENIESYEGRSEADSFDSEMVHVDFVDTPPHLQDEDDEDEDEDEDDDEDEDEDDALDSGSDEPDIVLLFDEVHPLLEDEVPNDAQVSRHDDEDSDKSLEYITSSHGSLDETENHEALKKKINCKP
ncbi:UNVERIFIED_CONTAM: hypothetical protein Sangu_1949600 [Sesamum angustifolium]|uniref:Uncharacterized protein n=1 Tax=Sesamum angustifolium TaxID=2727405 RepID=A0AAW2LYC2_9LAMI